MSSFHIIGKPGEEAARPVGHGRADRGGGEGWQALGQAGGGDVCGVPVVGGGDAFEAGERLPVVAWFNQ